MKLLVVEDDRMVAELVRWALREEGHTVDVASNAAQGSLLPLVQSYDGIVLDISLPDGSGLDIVRRLRREGQSTPILLLTGSAAPDDVVRGLDDGADDYLTKPFDVAVLKARVRAMLRRGGARRESTLSYGGITLDRRRREAVIAARPLRLTPKEFALLEYLLLHPEEVATRTELLEKVWDMRFDPGSNVVDVHVARLRSKLRHSGARPRVETVRGAGFILTLPGGDDTGSETEAGDAKAG